MATDPRNWSPPPGSDAWERAAGDAKYRRRSSQINTAIKWGWVAMFVLVGIAVLISLL
jgi:hypothetical protein